MVTVVAVTLLMVGIFVFAITMGEPAPETAAVAAADTTAFAPGTDSAEARAKELLRGAEHDARFDHHVPPGRAAWSDVGAWAGTGDKGTERFAVRSEEWRLVGSVERLGEAKESWVIVKIHDAGRNHVATFSIEEPGVDTGYVHTEPGLYYVTVGTKDAKWRLTAQERRPIAEQPEG